MSILFETTELRNLKLKNRFIRSATWEGMASEDGKITPELEQIIINLAKGGVGLIISSLAYILAEGQSGYRQIGINRDDQINGLRSMVRAVHDNNGKIFAQIVHAGFFANTRYIKRPAMTVSIVDGFAQAPREEMNIDYIHHVIEAFGLAAERAKLAGFDGIQLHAAHGYLLSQFLTPAFNKRNDEYGGSLENRARALLEVLARVRKGVGDEMPILVKMNCRDFHHDGLDLEESLKVAKMLQDKGIDAIELSGGGQVSGRLGPVRMGINSEDKEAYFREEAKVFKNVLSIPLILVGGIRSFNIAEKLVREGFADYISMSRPFIREPGLVNRWAGGDLRKSECVSDSRCFKSAIEGRGLICEMK